MISLVATDAVQVPRDASAHGAALLAAGAARPRPVAPWALARAAEEEGCGGLVRLSLAGVGGLLGCLR